MPAPQCSILPAATLAHRRGGLNNTGSNAVLIHALTGDAPRVRRRDLSDPGSLGSNGASSCTTERYFVVAANVLGGLSKSTGPASLAPDSALGFAIPVISTRRSGPRRGPPIDLLGIVGHRHRRLPGRPNNASISGRSLSAARAPPRRRLQARERRPIGRRGRTQIARPAGSGTWRGGDFAGPGPTAGLALARQVAHTTYRAGPALVLPQVTNPLHGGRLAVEDPTWTTTAKIVRRFDADVRDAVSYDAFSHDGSRPWRRLSPQAVRPHASSRVDSLCSSRSRSEDGDIPGVLPRKFTRITATTDSSSSTIGSHPSLNGSLDASPRARPPFRPDRHFLHRALFPPPHPARGRGGPRALSDHERCNVPPDGEYRTEAACSSLSGWMPNASSLGGVPLSAT